jgi:hypothetical protein
MTWEGSMAENRHVLFLVHGMGVQGKDWSGGMQKAIRGAFEKLPALSGVAFDDQFEFAPVRYDDFFDDLRTQWAGQARSLLDFLNPLATKGELGRTEKFIEKAAQAGGSFNKNDFAHTHLLDVFLYRFATQTREEVRVAVGKQILQKLTKLDRTSPIRWSVIAHSLGTSVAHDALHEAFTAGTLRDLTFPNALVMLANVSRVVESDIDVYTSTVAPGAPAAPRFGVRHYVNANNNWDPFPAPAPFEPVSTWPAPGVRDEGLYTDVLIKDIEAVNVHDVEHYIRNPRVHGPMFNAIFGREKVPAEEIAAAYAKYRAALPINRERELIDALKKLNPAAGDAVVDIVQKWRDFLRTVETR